MARRTAQLVAAGLPIAFALGTPGCTNDGQGPPPCAAIDPFVVNDGGLPEGTVVGFADLHAHPAVELAFGGRLIWGSAIDESDVNATQLPRIRPCPVETHNHDSMSPVDRTVGGVVFPAVASVAGYPHGPPSGVLGTHQIDAWPNARDIIHQQMNVASIRRAYESGLRLMFASATDDQVIAALLAGPNFVNGFVPDPSSDYESARRQLDWIQKIVEQNYNWMRIALTPRQARDIINGGRLAVVLALEMNGLREPDVASLIGDFGVKHIIPIHLIDNDVGGTAANGSLFNSASAAVSELYRPDMQPMRYMDVAASDTYAPSLFWPKELGTLNPPLYVGLNDISYSRYASLCYEPLGVCSGVTPAVAPFIQFGQVNARGLCRTRDECNLPLESRPSAARLLRLMGQGLIVDVSHMSAASVRESLTLAAQRSGSPYPLIASHGDIAHLCDGAQGACNDALRKPVTERALDAVDARKILDRKGVLGLGTSLGNYFSRTVIAARGGPLFTLDRRTGRTSACMAKPNADGSDADGCEPVPRFDTADPGTALQSIRIKTVGGPSGSGPNAHPFVRVELRGPLPKERYQRHVVVAPMDCSTQGCSATVDLGNQDPLTAPMDPPLACVAPACAAQSCSMTPYSLDDLESLELQWLYLACDAQCQDQFGVDVSDRRCASTWDDDRAPFWPIESVDLTAMTPDHQEVPFFRLGPRGPQPIVTLGRKRGSVVLYGRDDRPDSAADVLARHLLKVSVHSAPGRDEDALPGAGASRTGANVCVAVRTWNGSVCARPSPASGSECSPGWSKIDPRGEWPPDVTLSAYVHFPGHESDVCGVDMAILDWEDTSPSAFSVDEVRVDAIDDPVGHWVRRYADVSLALAGGSLGKLAFGTDFNGLNGLMDISEHPAPMGSLAPSACGTGGIRQPLAPMRFRNDDGTLGGEVLIDERGLATYGLLADLMAAIAAYPVCGPDVYRSLMLSAETTLRAWEAIANPNAQWPDLPKGTFACDPPPDVFP